MENFYDKEEVFEDKDFFVFDKETKAEEVSEEPAVKEEVIEKPVVKKKAKNDVAIYAAKEVVVEGILVANGYSKVSEDVAAIVTKHVKVRLASEDEIKKYLP